MSGSVAVSRGDEILGIVTGDAGISHSNTLLADVDKLLTETQDRLCRRSIFSRSRPVQEVSRAFASASQR